MMKKAELRARVLLSLQIALLGIVGERLRAVACRWTDTQIRIRAVFDGEIDAVDVESMSEVETEIISHFPDHQIEVDCCRIDAPHPITALSDEVFVFKRRELRD